MKFSIVTISFNQGAFLERSILSVLDQDYDDVEYIVVDPGSSDGSRAILDRYRSRITRLVLEPDAGPADGLNKGFAHATGDIYGFINADDELLPGAISRVASAFKKHADSDVIYGHGYIVDAMGRVVRRFRSTPFNARLYAFGAAVLVQQATFFRRRAFLDVGGFNVVNRTCWDGELWADLARRGARFRGVNEYWGLFRHHAGSISGSGQLPERYGLDRRRIFEKIVGREPRETDKGWMALARAERWLLDPRSLVIRLVDVIGGMPKRAAL